MLMCWLNLDKFNLIWLKFTLSFLYLINKWYEIRCGRVVLKVVDSPLLFVSNPPKDFGFLHVEAIQPSYELVLYTYLPVCACTSPKMGILGIPPPVKLVNRHMTV
jgi:hypothetical protein